MATKLVRFARIKNPNEHYAGHCSLPDIEENDVIQFTTETLDVTLTLHPQLRTKFQGGPEEIRITPGTPQTLTALENIVLSDELKKSKVTVKTIDSCDQVEINYYFQTIQPCNP